MMILCCLFVNVLSCVLFVLHFMFTMLFREAVAKIRENVESARMPFNGRPLVFHAYYTSEQNHFHVTDCCIDLEGVFYLGYVGPTGPMCMVEGFVIAMKDYFPFDKTGLCGYPPSEMQRLNHKSSLSQLERWEKFPISPHEAFEAMQLVMKTPGRKTLRVNRWKRYYGSKRKVTRGATGRQLYESPHLRRLLSPLCPRERRLLESYARKQRALERVMV